MLREQNDIAAFTSTLLLERPRLVALCAHLSGCSDIAEDLAQETLIEAWRHVGMLRDAAGISPWLTAIARNVCRRWARTYGREVGHRMAPAAGAGADALALLAAQAGDVDVEIDLERADLVTLLDRAMALLPPPTRAALVARYVDESPITEIAARLGSSEGTVAKKIARGKLALRRLLTTELRQDAAACGLPIAEAPAWQETHIWCMRCGARRLIGRFIVRTDTAEFALRCPACFAASGLPVTEARGSRIAQLVRGVKGFKPAFSRLSAWAHDYYRHGLMKGTLPCAQCGRPAVVRRHLPDDVPPSLRGIPGVHVYCVACQAAWWTTLSGLALWLPEGRRFWRRHPRIRALPLREVESAGCAALVVSFESVTEAARLDVICARDTYVVIRVHGAPTS